MDLSFLKMVTCWQDEGGGRRWRFEYKGRQGVGVDGGIRTPGVNRNDSEGFKDLSYRPLRHIDNGDICNILENVDLCGDLRRVDPKPCLNKLSFFWVEP